MSTPSPELQSTPDRPEPHPYLHEPVLWITSLPPYVTDENLAAAFATCVPFRPNIVRDSSNKLLSGTIEFKYLERAEKALATLQARPIPGLLPPVPLVLSPYPPTDPPTPLPPPSALPRLIKQLPPHFLDADLFELFHPFGALASVRTPTGFGPDTGSVEFWREEDARAAETAMHCADVHGMNISVQVYHARRSSSGMEAVPTHEFSPNANAPTFVPSGAMYHYPTQYSPPRPTPYIIRSPVFIHGPGQQVQLAPTSGPGSASHSGLIDPCNLFCKNLDPDIDSNGLFTHFRQFGQIVSARVMRNENGDSRGFGFVSFQTPDQANAAMHAMNGMQLGSKQIVVRLHEPKQLRQEKLAQRFGHNGHPRSASGATSPTVSEGGESYIGWSSPRQRTSALGSPVGSGGGYDHHHPHHHHRTDRGRRGSGSYYNAALSGTLNLPMRYDELAALSPVVRREVLTGELSRRVRALPPPSAVAPGEVDAVVETLVGMSLGDVVQGIQDPTRFAEQVRGATQALYPPPPSGEEEALMTQTVGEGVGLATRATPSPATSHDSRSMYAPNAASSGLLLSPSATASAPEHPSTPISVSASLSTPPRTSSPSGSVLPFVAHNNGNNISSGSGQAGGGGVGNSTATERERMHAAVARLETSRRTELTELLMSLSKRERALCLFNPEVLRAKIADAKVVLDSSDADVEQQDGAEPREQAQVVEEGAIEQPRQPTATTESASPSTSAPSPAPPASSSTATTMTMQQQHSLVSLAKLPAAEIVRLLTNVPSSTEAALPTLPKADPLVVKATDEFIDSLLDKPLPAQKQALGDKLHKVVKAFGIKGAPKLTITLLDSDDLRALAHLMNSYPAVLKEKAILVRAAAMAATPTTNK